MEKEQTNFFWWGKFEDNIVLDLWHGCCWQCWRRTSVERVSGTERNRKIEFGEKMSLKKLNVAAEACAGREAVMNYWGEKCHWGKAYSVLELRERFWGVESRPQLTRLLIDEGEPKCFLPLEGTWMGALLLMWSRHQGVPDWQPHSVVSSIALNVEAQRLH